MLRNQNAGVGRQASKQASRINSPSATLPFHASYWDGHVLFAYQFDFVEKT
jgi:hypothetical protein